MGKAARAVSPEDMEHQFKADRGIISSMTPSERQTPEC